MLLEQRNNEQRNSAATMTQLCHPDHEITINNVRIRIPNKVAPSIAKHALELALDIARNGVGEGTRATGFLIILASKADFEDRNFGYCSKMNKFKGNNVIVKDWKEHSRFLFPSFVQDGGMIIDCASEKCLGDQFSFQLFTEDADKNGGLGHKNASSAGMLYGCIAIKFSADDYGCDRKGKGLS